MGARISLDIGPRHALLIKRLRGHPCVGSLPILGVVNINVDRIGTVIVRTAGVVKANNLELRRDSLSFRCLRLALVRHIDRRPQQSFEIMTVYRIWHDDFPWPHWPGGAVKGHRGGRNIGNLCRGPYDLRKPIVVVAEQSSLRPLVDLRHMVHAHHLPASCRVNRAIRPTPRTVNNNIVESLARVSGVNLVTNMACDDGVHC